MSTAMTSKEILEEMNNLDKEGGEILLIIKSKI